VAGGNATTFATRGPAAVTRAGARQRGAKGEARSRFRAAAAAVVALALLGPATARAQDDDSDGVYVVDPALEPKGEAYVPELRTAPRFAFGFDGGVGSFSCSGCSNDRFTGLSVDVFTGAQLARRLALLVRGWGVFTYRPEGSRNAGWVIVDFNTVEARLWVTPTLWVDAGAGPALLVSTVGVDGLTEVAPGFTLAVGGELEHRPNRGIELSLRLGYAAFDDDSAGGLWTVAAAVGLHLYP